MTKKELKFRLKNLELTQVDFFKICRVGIRVGNNYKDSDEMPEIYEAIILLLEENARLKKERPQISQDLLDRLVKNIEELTQQLNNSKANG